LVHHYHRFFNFRCLSVCRAPRINDLDDEDEDEYTNRFKLIYSGAHTTVTGLPTKDETSETGECRKIYIGNSALLGDKVFFKRVNPIQLDLLTQAKNYHFRGITVFSNQTELR